MHVAFLSKVDSLLWDSFNAVIVIDMEIKQKHIKDIIECTK
jgi:hypothetical protein